MHAFCNLTAVFSDSREWQLCILPQRSRIYCQRLVNFLMEQGGLHALADFEEFETEWVEPLRCSYRGWTIRQLPPNEQGMAALHMLNIMENFPLRDYGHNSAAALHVMIEAKKLAYADPPC